MKRRILTAVCATVAMLFAWSVYSQAQEFKIGFVDVMKLMDKSTKAKEQQQKLAQLVDKEKKDLEAKMKEMMDLKDQLEKQGPMLKEDTRNDMMKKLGLKEMEYKLQEREAQNKVQNEQRDLSAIFQKDVRKVISQLRGEKKLTLIFDAQALLSADDALDLTDEVVKLYDASALSPRPAPKPAATPAPAKPKAK
jgi:outer membrane protein